jgi:putative transposase
MENNISGIIRNHKHKVYAIGSMPDHIPIFISYNQNQRIPDLINELGNIG